MAPSSPLRRRSSHTVDDTAIERRIITVGNSIDFGCDNSVRTSKYTVATFLPIAVREQFRRFGNIYFLGMGIIMAIGYYTPWFDSAVSPWTTLGPLAVVISISLAQEGFTDLNRHRSDTRTNFQPCVLLKRSEECGAALETMGEVTADDSESISFDSVPRSQILAGDLIYIKNREMVPADTVILASAGERGSAYIETSSIDGETNLKLRSCPNLEGGSVSSRFISEKSHETVEEAVRRISRFTVLGERDWMMAIQNPHNVEKFDSGKKASNNFRQQLKRRSEKGSNYNNAESGNYVATLASEEPNASVHTFSGQLYLPPPHNENQTLPSPVIPLDAENLLLRGAVLRNTEWVIGVAVFTGRDTKLVQNSQKVPSKFSKLDRLVNRTIIYIVLTMIVLVVGLAGMATYANFTIVEDLWYAGYSPSDTRQWPYLPNLDPPVWKQSPPKFYQNVLLFITLLNNFVPLSLYITMEMVTFVVMYYINSDLEMYDPATDTPAVARSTTVTDLGLVEYVFSDKTGTLTQNVMNFKRCCVDGMVFGSPVVKSAPPTQDMDLSVDENERRPFHPLNNLLVGDETGGGMTFNAEMFLRVMSLCHTVVVEKNIDEVKPELVEERSSSSFGLKRKKKIKSLKTSKADSETSNADSGTSIAPNIDRKETAPTQTKTITKGVNGAPPGYDYQAESPDEGALVSAASEVYNFQLLERNSNGIELLCNTTSVFQNKEICDRLRKGDLHPENLSASLVSDARDSTLGPRKEIWSILAVNKFDSERKRMSILLRSPPELGNLPILFCKGADSNMLHPSVASLENKNNPPDNDINNTDEFKHKRSTSRDESNTNAASMLGLEAHLGDFATEGLRTLVLGVRILTETECTAWLKIHAEASRSISDREDLLKRAAIAIETDVHIVGATAIEDKLQDGVPDTIAALEQMGIKVWVLTGDKRETAVEIGYSTKVLTPGMQVLEFRDSSPEKIREEVATEFLRLVKCGKLMEYQRSSMMEQNRLNAKNLLNFRREFGRKRKEGWRCIREMIGCCDNKKNSSEEDDQDTLGDNRIIQPSERRKAVRDYADKLMQEKRAKNKQLPEEDGVEAKDLDDNADIPDVFKRASAAREMMEAGQQQCLILEDRNVNLANFTSQKKNLTDEDLESLASFMPNKNDDATGMDSFDKGKRTLMERVFAVDREVRHGRLGKHVRDSFRQMATSINNPYGNTSRALVIEGSALSHILGDPLLEEMLFSIASSCNSVIVCRASPKQKALVIKLVQSYLSPTPVTLAIGDGANDVGMIQEAQIGVGISGKEGQQAVNASDFAIAQFRFLKELLLVHGRWNFIRMSKVVLFSFYKNSILVGFLVVYSAWTLYSGTPLFDQWVTSVLNFVASFPIFFTGLFDRDLDKEYIRKNPRVYRSGPGNEYMSNRVVLRWLLLILVHIFMMYSMVAVCFRDGGGITSAFGGLMRNETAVGDGEGGDLLSYGTLIYTTFILTLCYKVLFESRTIIHGEFPCVTCQKDKGEGWMNRLPYTWIGTVVLSWGFYLYFIYQYSLIARDPSSIDVTMNTFTDLAMHVLNMRTLSWALIILVPTAACAFDVSLKVFGNMYFPTQSQIHLEIAVAELKEKQRRKKVMITEEVVQTTASMDAEERV